MVGELTSKGLGWKVSCEDVHTCLQSDVLSAYEGEEAYDMGFAGDCVTDVVKLNGFWWAVTNTEYASRIDFCPFCGAVLP